MSISPPNDNSFTQNAIARPENAGTSTSTSLNSMRERERGRGSSLGLLLIAILPLVVFIAYLVVVGEYTMGQSLRDLWLPALTATATATATEIIAAGVDTGGVNQGGVDVRWYPPKNTSINDLNSALHGSGIYGFIFDSSDTPDAEYGTYNWCNMPHVRKEEYVRAGEGFELRYVEVIQRHHKRTPYASNAFPVEAYHWDCDDQGLYYYGSPFGQDPRRPAQSFWEGFESPVNPFVPSGWIGTCQFPQLTAPGLDDAYVHGKDIYGVYHDLLNFLPSRDDDDGGGRRRRRGWPDKVVYRVTQNVITSQVAGMLIGGTWDTTSPTPLLIAAVGVDSLEPQYSCPAADALFNSIKSSSDAPWQAHLDGAAEIYRQLDSISGVAPTDAGFHASFDHYFDNLSARQCHAKPLPCKVGTNGTDEPCIDQALADTVYRLGQWEYSRIYRDAPQSLAASVASYGVWIAELAGHLRAVIERKGDKPLYFHNVAHDGSVSRLLSILQIEVMVWPGMGSEVVFELYEQKQKGRSLSDDRGRDRDGSGAFYVRVLFGGRVLRSSSPTLGVMDMVPAETLLAYFDGLVGKDASLVVGKCNETVKS
ncbi:phosphoglycerate mutase-like protein [Xylaria venustula]|nr:phosphoglycerate mutase-like protein [Xylaria venustula]